MSIRTVTETYTYLRQIAPPFAQQITAAARAAHNEAEFEHVMNNAIATVAQDLGVTLDFRQEYTLAQGRADAVYNRLVIEYENPGALRPQLSHGATQHAVQQVKGYLTGLAQAEHQAPDRLLGVAFDGYYFIFVRYHEGHVIVEEPLNITPASAERFLRSLFSLASGRALVPENLVEDFGSQNDLSRQVTAALYTALTGHADDLTQRLFTQWQHFFGETAGFEAAGGKIRHRQELRAFAEGMGLHAGQADIPRFFFAIQTYFSFLVKNIARLVLQAHVGGTLGTTPLTTIANLHGEALRAELRRTEDGGIFRALGIKNLLEGDFFAWYLSAWDAPLEEALRRTLARLAGYNPATVQDDPHSTRDLLKKLYHYLLPREIRHDLGEFYTPDWLAERLLMQLGEPLFQMPAVGRMSYPSTIHKRLLDPACGSGTFPVLAIRALKANCRQAGLAEGDTLDIILNSIVGIDLNPLAVLAARVNYLLAIADLLPYRRREVEIPIYLADSVLTPARGEGLFEQDRRILETAVGTLPLPDTLNSREKMERFADVLETCVDGGFAPDVFVDRCRRELPEVVTHVGIEHVLTELFAQLSDLHRRGLDSIWVRVLKNAFMPLFVEPCDYVVGNPPWINWESLPQGYREQTTPLWHDYGLFVHSGMDTILGKGKKDLSTLMTYVAADRYLKPGGKLGFVITQSVWKTAGAGQGFRRFRIGAQGAPLGVLHVDDLSSLQVFEGASTRTSIFVLRKGEPTRYPLPYTYWQKTKSGRLDYDSTLEEVLEQTRRLNFRAAPVDAADPTSAWLTARPKALDAVRKVLGESDYQAHAGACTWANGIYWVEIMAERPDGPVIVQNFTEGAKREVEQVTADLEPDLLYPLLRGRDVHRWQAKPSLYILMLQDPETRRGIDEITVQTRWPRTWAYLKRFEKPLRARSGFTRYFTRKDARGKLVETGPFYSMFNVGDYTFAPWKVVWRGEVATSLVSAVISTSGSKAIIPDQTAYMVAFEDQDAAHFFCGVLNTVVVQLIYQMFTYKHVSMSFIQNLRIPRYDPANPTHRRLAELSQEAHRLAPAAYAGDVAAQTALRRVEAAVDEAARALWGLTEAELHDIRRNLAELHSVQSTAAPREEE
ncbi:MAG TPA: N-6 DNA methylase [Anaerolineae bacterium]|nr:N-6 DNA methylase [Anaerolineae bacterium]HQH37332.1 N-6 DNA methylase [Anaerolineae bacterium]